MEYITPCERHLRVPVPSTLKAQVVARVAGRVCSHRPVLHRGELNHSGFTGVLPLAQWSPIVPNDAAGEPDINPNQSIVDPFSSLHSLERLWSI